MLQLLRSNSVIVIVLAAGSCALSAVLGWREMRSMDHVTPVAEAVTGWSARYREVGIAVTTLLLLAIALLSNRLARRFQIISGKGDLVIWTFSLLALLVMPGQNGLPLLLCSFFVVLAFHEMLRFNDPAAITVSAFNAGFFIACGALFYPHSALLVLLAVVAFVSGQPQTWRPAFTFVLGLATPLLLTWTGWFILDRGSHFLRGQVSVHLDPWTALPEGNDLVILVAMTTVIILYAGASIVSLGQRPLQFRNYFTMTAWFLVATLLLVPIDARAFPYAFLPATIPVSIFAGESLHRGSGKFGAELMHLALVAAAILVTYMRA
jgi:hypothetical protein